MATSDTHPEFGVYVPDVTLAVATRAVAPGDPVSGFTAESGFTLSDNGGGVLSITDNQSRFGTKPNGSKPAAVIDLSNGGDGSTVAAWSRRFSDGSAVWISDEVGSSEVLTSIVKPGSSASRNIRLNTNIDGYDQTSHIDVSGYTGAAGQYTGDKRFYHIDWYNDFLWQETAANNPLGNFNVKWARFQSYNAQTSPYVPQTMQGDSQRFNFGPGSGVPETSNIGGYELSTSLNRYNVKAWRSESQLLKTSSAEGVADAEVYQYLDGSRLWAKTGALSHGTGYSPTAYPYDHFKLVGAADFSPLANEKGFVYDLIYLDDSWCRIYITDKPTWVEGEAKSMEIQIPLDWLSGKIDFQFRQGAFATLTGSYLWVVDNDDNKILVGGWQ